jgi:hypothetical protein
MHYYKVWNFEEAGEVKIFKSDDFFVTVYFGLYVACSQIWIEKEQSPTSCQNASTSNAVLKAYSSDSNIYRILHFTSHL